MTKVELRKCNFAIRFNAEVWLENRVPNDCPTDCGNLPAPPPDRCPHGARREGRLAKITNKKKRERKALQAYRERMRQATEAIESGRLSGKELVDAYRERGLMFLENCVLAWCGLYSLPGYGLEGRAHLDERESREARDRAIEDFDYVLKIGTEDAKSLVSRGRLCQERARSAFVSGDFRAAIADYKRAAADYEKHMSVDGNSALADECRAEVYTECGASYYELGEHHQAIACYDKVIALASSSEWGTDFFPSAHGYRGDAWKAVGEPERAIRDWKIAFRIDARAEIQRWQDRLKPDVLYAALEGGKTSLGLEAALRAYAYERDG